MNYRKEDDPERIKHIDCYWESHDMANKTLYVYPSLPEPYINLYFPISSKVNPLIKGISSNADFFKMKSKLFGVRLFLRGYYQLQLAPCSEINNNILNLNDISGSEEIELSENLLKADSFKKRILLFQNYFKLKCEQALSTKQNNIADAFQFLVKNYKNTGVIQHYAKENKLSPRTITRWFSSDLGISPKKVVRISQFHKALEGLHSEKESGFYFDCGYYDQSHFIREFKKFTGISPKKYLSIVSDLYN